MLNMCPSFRPSVRRITGTTSVLSSSAPNRKEDVVVARAKKMVRRAKISNNKFAEIGIYDEKGTFM